MDENELMIKERNERITLLGNDGALKTKGLDFTRESIKSKYSYNFTWLGRPIIQYPQDIVAVQEIMWSVCPDLVIETGIAHGGSLMLSASIITLLEFSGLIKTGMVLGIDIDIRNHNRVEIEKHPLSKKIKMIQGSSVDPSVIKEIHDYSKSFKKILVILDSNHTNNHVLAELDAYASLVSKGSYCIVFDTIIEDMPENSFPDRPWNKGNNPKTAVWAFLKNHPEFEIDSHIENKLLISVAPGGYLKRIK